MILIFLTLLPLVLASDGRDIGYDNYDQAPYPDSRWQFAPSSPGGPVTECGTPWRALLAGVVLGALVKVPLLILGKLLLLKAAAPLAMAGALLPLGVFSIYRVVQQQQQSGNSTSRALPPSCLHATACKIGAIAPNTVVHSTSWLLKAIGQAVQKEWEDGGQVEAYREAYMSGAANKACSDYPCPFF